MLPQQDKYVYFSPKASILFNEETLETVPLWSRTRQGCPLLSLLFNIVLDVSTNTSTQAKSIRGIRMSKEEIKLSLFADDVIL